MKLKNLLASALLLAAGSFLYAQDEPDMKTALTWWEEETNVWTPIGWKDNYLRYAVLYNGALMIDPSHGLMGPRQNCRPFIGKDFMLTFHARPEGTPWPLPDSRVNVRSIDYGHGIQGWENDHETPVLWTEYRIQDGLIVREKVFAHQAGASDCVTGMEPLFAWVRLEVIFVEPRRHPQTFPMAVQLSRVYFEHDAECYRGKVNEPSFKIMVNPAKAPYGEPLSFAQENGAIVVSQPDGIRMAAYPAGETALSYSTVAKGIWSIRADLKCEVGQHVDILLPLLVQPKEVFEAEAALGYDGALKESDEYWAYRPASAGRVHVPEPYINEAIERNIKFAPVIAEKDRVTGDYSYLTGAWGYDCLWQTPTSMISHMMADQLGYHDLTRRYSKIFLDRQGTTKAPGAGFQLHPGYLGVPKTLTAVDWLSDHGAILLQMATCCILSHDQEIIDEYLPAIIKACEFLKDASALTDHDGVKGLLPPAVATDDEKQTQAVASIAWNYKGLCEAVRLLKRIEHPRAAEFEEFAEQTRKIFQEAYHKIAENGPRWTDDQGNKRYLPPTTLSATPPPFHGFQEAFYLDGGPMILVWAGLMDADDPVMADLVEFFRNGPDKRFYTPIYNCIWRPSLQHEISTCEPCYSWNVFFNWQLADRQRYLEGMYSLFAGGMSQNTYISCEHRHGIQGNLFVGPLAIYLAKLAVIDDQIEDGALHLLRICPKAWLSKEEETVWENIPTEYGPVTLKFRLSKNGKKIIVTFGHEWKTAGKPKVFFHTIPVDGVKHIVINGHRYRNKATRKPIRQKRFEK